MLFNAELVRFKSMKDGIRIELDVPTIDSTRVMQAITNFLERPLKVDMNIDSAEAVKSFVVITDSQKAKINMCYSELSKKFELPLVETKERLKASSRLVR